jgi:phosphoenolpyruvate---glycerone phosphotransferase subunit DhaM
VSRVGLVVVSHSAGLAAGVVEVAAQMAPDVTAVAAGGTADGGIGTDFDAVSAAIARADDGAGVVVLYDLGSARMVAEMAVELADNARLADGPLVEGAVAAAVAAQGGADVAEVAHAAENAAAVPGSTAPAENAAGVTAPETEPPVAGTRPAEVTVTLTNEIGLHARPAAVVARAMTGFDAVVTVHFKDAAVDGRSVLALMALGARGGDQVRVSAVGPQAEEALRTFQELAEGNFGE